MYVNKNIYLFDGTPLTQTCDIRTEKDLIAEIASTLTPLDNEEVIDGKASVAFPGLTDAHRHVWQAPFKGFASDMMLLEYLDKAVADLGSRISAEDLYSFNLYGYLEAGMMPRITPMTPTNCFL